MQLHRRLSLQIKDLAKRFDVAQHRILAAVENERPIAADLQSVLEAGQRRLGRDMAKIQREQTAETEALLQLFREFEPRAPMPSSGRWAMDPTRLLEVLFLIGRKLPKVVLELGSGTSSIWIAYALEKDGGASSRSTTRRSLRIAPSHSFISTMSVTLPRYGWRSCVSST
jgi:hypothetical protein